MSGPHLSGKARTDRSKTGLPRVLAFVDESGDRNCGPRRQSNHFTMTAVLIAAEDVDQLKITVGGLKALWGIAGELHWVQHARVSKTGRRDQIARVLGALPAKVIHVVMDRDRRRRAAGGPVDPVQLRDPLPC